MDPSLLDGTLTLVYSIPVPSAERAGGSRVVTSCPPSLLMLWGSAGLGSPSPLALGPGSHGEDEGIPSPLVDSPPRGIFYSQLELPFGD